MDMNAYEKAQQLYAQTGNMSEVYRIMRQGGHTESYNTLCNWRSKSKPEWDNLRNTVTRKKQENFTDSLDDNLFKRMVSINDLLLEKVEENLQSDDPKIDTQAIIVLQRSVEQILTLLNARKDEAENVKKGAKRLIQLLQKDPIIGPRLNQILPTLIEQIKRERKRGRL